MVNIIAKCSCGFLNNWNSQPTHSQMPLGNLLLSASILFSGNSPSKILQYFQQANVQFITERCYNYIQSGYLIPSVLNVWKKHQTIMMTERQGKQVVIGGDGRCDSPGYCAKYCSYSCMDLESNKILDTQLVQVTSSIH